MVTTYPLFHPNPQLNFDAAPSGISILKQRIHNLLKNNLARMPSNCLVIERHLFTTHMPTVMELNPYSR